MSASGKEPVSGRGHRKVVFEGRSLSDLRGWPKETRQAAGFQLDRVQKGLPPDDWRPMKTIGQGVREIRLEASSRQWRIIYVQIDEQRVHVLHCFQKASRKTGKRDLDIARNRLRAILR